MTYFKNLSLLAAVLLTGIIFIGCSETKADQSSSEPYIVTIDAVDYAFAMPSEIKSGWVTFKFNNIGEEVHYASITKFKNDITEEEWVVANSGNGKEFVETTGGFSFEGGPGYHIGGMSSEVTVYLEPGSYNIFCEVKTPDGIEHRHLGMKKFFRVVEENSGASRPQADMTLTLKPIYIESTGELAPGTQTVEIVHAAEQLGLSLVQLNDTSTIYEGMKFMDKFHMPTEARLLTGAEQTGDPFEDSYQERKSYITVDLEPGEYAWMSQSYAGLGMIRKFMVSENAYTEQSGYSSQQSETIEVQLTEQGLQMPKALESGRYEFSLDSAGLGSGTDSHYLVLNRLMEGKTVRDYIEYIASRDSGGERLPRPTLSFDMPIESHNLKSTETEKPKFDLHPGRYVMACTNWQWEYQSKHIEKGEYASFEVK